MLPFYITSYIRIYTRMHVRTHADMHNTEWNIISQKSGGAVG